MSEGERAEHDEAWGLDFGDFNDIWVAYEQKEHKENLFEHPMSRNMIDKVAEYIKVNPSAVTDADEQGYTWLHSEALAGNLNIVELLLSNGADKNARTKSGKTALDFARLMNLGGYRKDFILKICMKYMIKVKKIHNKFV